MLPKQQLESKYNYAIKKNYHLKKTDASPSGIQIVSIDIKNQILFRDLQLMLENKHIPAVMWNDEIERQLQDKIIAIQQKAKGEFSLKDIYFSDVQKQKLEILDCTAAKQDKNQVINELKLFGNKIKSMNNLFLGQYGKPSLESLLKLAISFYSKIRVKKFYSDDVQEEKIMLRYITEQILMNPDTSQNVNENKNLPFLYYEDEDDITRIITSYSNQLKNDKNIKIGEFYLTQIFRKNVNQIRYQNEFINKMRDKMTPNNVSEKLVQMMNDFQGFKQWALLWVVEKHINCDQTITHPIVAKSFLEVLDQSQFIAEYSNLQDQDIYGFLLKLSDKITKKASENNQQIQNYEENEMKIQIKNVIGIIRQKRNITDIDIENLDENELIEKLYKELCSTLIQNVTLIGFFDLTKDMQSYLIIENYYLTYLLSFYGNQFLKFFSDQTLNRITETTQKDFKQFIKDQSLKMQQLGESYIDSTINIYNQALCFLGQFSQNNQEKQYDQCLQEFPVILKIYFSVLFKKKQTSTMNKISMFVEQQGQQFQKQLDWYKSYLRTYIEEISENFSSKQNGQIMQSIFSKLTKKWMNSLEKKLLNEFIPYINMQEFIKTKQFKDLCSSEIRIQQGKYDFLISKYQAYKEFIQASINQYKEVKQMNPDFEEKNNQFENNLLEQYLQKILEQESLYNQIDNQLGIKNQEKVEICFQIKEYMNSQITESIQTRIQSIQEKKYELYEQLKKKFNFYYLPFQCIENQISEIVWHKPENEQQKYFEKLGDFSQQVENQVAIKCQKYQRLFNFGLIDLKKQELELFIKEKVIEEFREMIIEQETKEQLLNLIDHKIKLFYDFSEEEMNRKIQDKQDYFLNQYLREIYEITDQQCKEILIPDIPLDKLEIDKLQEYRPQFIIIVEESQNQQDLERRTFQYFQKQALSFVLENYQNQIEKRLKEINDPD